MLRPFRSPREGVAKLRAAPPALPPRPAMPQFEFAPPGGDAVFVRARDAEGAVRDVIERGLAAEGLAANAAVELGDPEAGSGWMAVALGGEPWGRVRQRDRMRFRRD